MLHWFFRCSLVVLWDDQCALKHCFHTKNLLSSCTSEEPFKHQDMVLYCTKSGFSMNRSQESLVVLYSTIFLECKEIYLTFWLRNKTFFACPALAQHPEILGRSPADEASTDGHLFTLIHHTGGLARHYSILVVSPCLACSALHSAQNYGKSEHLVIGHVNNSSSVSTDKHENTLRMDYQASITGMGLLSYRFIL